MRKIETLEKRNRKDARNKIILSIILIGVMIFSTAGYAFYHKKDNTESTEKYKGLNFVNYNGYWLVEIQGHQFSFLYHPKDTENISIDLNLNLNNYINKPLYFVNGNQGEGEIARNLQNFVLRMQEACYENCEEDLPIKNCTNNLIIFNKGEAGISQKDSCVFITSSDNEAARVSDAFVYRLLGVR